jgi:hypothetical protein
LTIEYRQYVMMPSFKERKLHTVRTGRCAAVGVVTELVNVHATLSVGVVAADVP